METSNSVHKKAIKNILVYSAYLQVALSLGFKYESGEKLPLNNIKDFIMKKDTDKFLKLHNTLQEVYNGSDFI